MTTVIFAAGTAVALLIVPVSNAAGALLASMAFISVSPQLVMLNNGKPLTALISWVASAAALGLIFGILPAVSFFVLFTVFGAVFQLSLRSNGAPLRKVAGTALWWSVCFLAFIYVWPYLTGEPLILQIEETVRKVGAVTISAYYDHRVAASLVEAIERQIIRNATAFTGNFFAWTLAAAFSGSWFTYAAVSRKTAGMDKPASLESFRMPEGFIWVLLAAGAVFAFKDRVPFGGFPVYAGTNIAVVMLSGYFVNGLALVLLFFSGLGFAPLVKWIFILAAVIFFRAAYFFMFAGILDVWLDFRKRKTEVVK